MSCLDAEIVCQRISDTITAFAVRLNGDLLELKVGQRNGDFVHELLVNRDLVATIRKPAPFWDEPFVIDRLDVELLTKVTQEAMVEGVLERICRTCRTSLEVNGRPLYVRCESCGWLYCPDCFAHFVRPTRCWGCWRKEVGTHVQRRRFKGTDYDAVDAERLAELFLDWASIIRFSDTGDTFIFDFYRLRWINDGERQLERFFYRTLRMRFLKNKVRQYIIGYVLAEVTQERSEVPMLPLELVPAADCFVDARTMRRVEIDPARYFYRDRHPSPYRPGARCDRFDRFVREITSSEDAAATLVELMGFCLWRSYAINAIFVFLGEGANGKTTFAELLADLVGRGLTSAESIFSLTKVRFASASLVDMSLNIDTDMPEGTIHNSAILKQLSGNDTSQAEKKNKDSFPFVNHAKLVFSCNDMPKFVDSSYGFWRRMKVIEFKSRFDIDTELPRQLREELPGIFNRALEGLQRLLDRYEFSLETTPESTRAEYMGEGDSVFTFVRLFLEDGDGELEEAVVHQKYKQWCNDNHLRDIVSQDKLWKEINRHHPDVVRKRKKNHEVLEVDGRKTETRPYHYFGLRWSAEWDG